MPPPDCAACKRPSLRPGNQGAWDLFWTVADLLGDDWGGVHLENARLAALARQDDWDEELLLKLTWLVRFFLKKQDLDEDGDGD